MSLFGGYWAYLISRIFFSDYFSTNFGQTCGFTSVRLIRVVVISCVVVRRFVPLVLIILFYFIVTILNITFICISRSCWIIVLMVTSMRSSLIVCISSSLVLSSLSLRFASNSTFSSTNFLSTSLSQILNSSLELTSSYFSGLRILSWLILCFNDSSVRSSFNRFDSFRWSDCGVVRRSIGSIMSVSNRGRRFRNFSHLGIPSISHLW